MAQLNSNGLSNSENKYNKDNVLIIRLPKREYESSSCTAAKLVRFVIEQRTGAGQGIIIRMASIVALDIETTGLNYSDDAIIEIGAVCFNNRRIEGEWSTLINPGNTIWSL